MNRFILSRGSRRAGVSPERTVTSNLFVHSRHFRVLGACGSGMLPWAPASVMDGAERSHAPPLPPECFVSAWMIPTDCRGPTAVDGRGLIERFSFRGVGASLQPAEGWSGKGGRFSLTSPSQPPSCCFGISRNVQSAFPPRATIRWASFSSSEVSNSSLCGK